MIRRLFGRKPLACGLAIATLVLAAMPAVAAIETDASREIALLSGRSQLYTIPGVLERVAIGDPKVLDIKVIDQHQYMLRALSPGTTSLLLWTKDKGVQAYEVKVGLDAADVQRQVRGVTRNTGLTVGFNGKSFLLSGRARTIDEREAAEKIAGSYGQPVINLIQLPQRRDQVMINVHVVELTRTGALNLGVSVGGAQVTSVSNGIRNQVFKPWELNFSEQVAGNIGSFSQFDLLAAKIELLQRRGEAKLLARPTLVTVDGGTAKFLAGGEIPIPIQQALGTTTILWREFGVKLEIQPTLVDDGRIALSIKPEVSSLDFSSGIRVADFSIPALKTRRTETQVLLGPQETLMLGGLLSNEQVRGYDMIPGLGDVPILGELFRSRRFQDNQTELAILVTPRLIAPEAAMRLPGQLEDTYESLVQDEGPAHAPAQ